MIKKEDAQRLLNNVSLDWMKGKIEIRDQNGKMRSAEEINTLSIIYGLLMEIWSELEKINETMRQMQK